MRCPPWNYGETFTGTMKKKKEIEEEELGTQLISHSAGIHAVHKVRGLTFSREELTSPAECSPDGQAYVALSRCTLLEGIQLKSSASRADIPVRLRNRKVGRFNNRQAFCQDKFRNRHVDVQYAGSCPCWTKEIEACLNSFSAIHPVTT